MGCGGLELLLSSLHAIDVVVDVLGLQCSHSSDCPGECSSPVGAPICTPGAMNMLRDATFSEVRCSGQRAATKCLFRNSICGALCLAPGRTHLFCAHAHTPKQSEKQLKSSKINSMNIHIRAFVGFAIFRAVSPEDLGSSKWHAAYIIKGIVHYTADAGCRDLVIQASPV